MKRKLRLALVLLAALIHLGAPVAVYAESVPAALPGDFCSAARGASAAPSDKDTSRSSHERHCAHAPCCTGGAPDSTGLPPRVSAAFLFAHEPVRAPESTSAAAAFAAILAAQPRGPPALL